MRVALYSQLVSPEELSAATFRHTLGFGFTPTYLRENHPDVEVRCVRTREAVVDSRPDLICIASTSEMWEHTKESARWLRREGFGGPIAITGPHVTALPETLPPEADCGILESGERTFLELVRAYGKSRRPDLSQIEGVAFRDPDGRVISTPAPTGLELDSGPVDLTESAFAAFPLITVRGYVGSGVHDVTWDDRKQTRLLSAEKLVRTMKQRFRLTGNPRFVLHDDVFPASSDRVRDIRELMRRQDLLGRIVIDFASVSASDLNEDTAEMLRDMGVRMLRIADATPNPAILKRLTDGAIGMADVDRAIRAADKARIPIRAALTYGCPGDVREEIVDSMERSLVYERDTLFRRGEVRLCQPIPGSRLWSEELARGRVSPGMDFSSLRPSGYCRFFTSPWHWGAEPDVSREDFRRILTGYDMLPIDCFETEAPVAPEAAKKTGPVRRAERESAFARAMQKLRDALASRRNRAIAFYGAGRHSRDLLDAIPLWELIDPARFVGFISDDPDQTRSLCGYPVLAPGEALARADAIVISTDLYQARIEQRLTELGFSGEVIALYDDAPHAGKTTLTKRADASRSRGLRGLEEYEEQVYSGGGEDGVIRRILDCIGETNRYFVEFGVLGDPPGNSEYNCRLLREQGWTGLLMDIVPYPPDPAIKQETITAENINELFAKYDVPESFDLLSIDIDGNDYWVWQAIDDRYKPRVVIIEYNAHVPPDQSKAIAYDPHFRFSFTDYSGGSLLAMARLGREKGYGLVHCESMGVNAFFVRKELLGEGDERTVAEAYRPPRYGRNGNGHPPDPTRKMIEV